MAVDNELRDTVAVGLRKFRRLEENFEREIANYYFGEKTESFKLSSRQENPLKFIRDLSQTVMDDVIENVCHEMLTSDIVTDLIQKELQN